MFDQMHASLEVKAHPLDFGDDNSYFTKQTLRNLIAVNGYSAKGELPSSLQSDGNLVVDYLDHREALRPLLGVDWPAIHSPDADSVLQRLTDTTRLGLNSDQWDSSNRLSHLIGSLSDETGVVLFLQGKQLHAVRISPDEHPEVLDSAKAALELDEYVKKEVAANSTSDMTLFSVLKFADGS